MEIEVGKVLTTRSDSGGGARSAAMVRSAAAIVRRSSTVDELAALRRQVLKPDGKSVSDHAEIDERNVHQYDVQLGCLRQLIVLPRYRHARLGRRLVEEVELEAMLENRPELVVHAWVESVEFYRARGLEIRGRVVSGPGVPWQEMVKPLLAPR